MTDAARAWLFRLFSAALPFLGACSAPGDGPSRTSAAAATAFPNDQPAYDYFLAKGLTSFQAAGIVGNLDQESGVDPTAVQSGGPGRGIAQWSVGGRWDTDANDNLVAYAAAAGLPTTSLTVQLDFIWYELQTFSDYGLATLRATTTVTDATIAFETDFEGCSACDEATRIAYAEDVLKAYGNDPVPDAGQSDADARDAAASTSDAAADAEIPVKAADDAGAPAKTPGSTNDAGGGGEGTAPSLEASRGSSGCAVAGAGWESPARGWWLFALGFLVAGARRRAARS